MPRVNLQQELVSALGKRPAAESLALGFAVMRFLDLVGSRSIGVTREEFAAAMGVAC